jgi:sugar phosphate isomerase/epimerase
MSNSKRLLCGLAAALVITSPSMVNAVPTIPDDAKTGGFAVGVQAWTFRKFSVMEAIEKTAQTGAKVIELFPGQQLSPDSNVKFDHNASAEVFAAVKTQLGKHGVRAVNYGVVGVKGEAEWRKVFEMARELGLYAISTEEVDQLDILEKLVKEFDIAVGIHHHMKQPNNPNYKVWDPNYILSVVKDRDPRIGAAADTGHWATSGITPLDALKVLKGRIISVHLKDRVEIGKATPDAIFGTGILDVKSMLDELKSQKFVGNISIEYEHNWDNSVPDVAQCVGFFRGYATCK